MLDELVERLLLLLELWLWVLLRRSVSGWSGGGARVVGLLLVVVRKR